MGSAARGPQCCGWKWGANRAWGSRRGPVRLLRRAGAEARPERSVVGQGTTGLAAGVRETEKVASEEPERGSLGGAGRAQNLRGDPLDCGVLYPECIKPCEPCRSCFEFYLFTFGCAGSSLLCMAFLQLRRGGFTLWWPLLSQSMGSGHTGFSSCGAWA